MKFSLLDGMKPEEINQALRESGKRMFGESFKPVSTSMEDFFHEKPALHEEPSQTLYETLKDRLWNFFKRPSDESELETTVNEPGTAINQAGHGLFRRLITAAMLAPLAYIAAEVGANYVQHREPVKTVWAGDTSAAAVNLDAYLVQIESNFVDTGKRITIDDYYRRSIPRDDIAPRARMGKYKIGINGIFYGIFSKTWESYTNDNHGEKAKQVEDTFSKYGLSDIFQYFKDNSDKIFYLAFQDNFMVMYQSSKDYKIITNVPSEFTTEMKKSGLSK